MCVCVCVCVCVCGGGGGGGGREENLSTKDTIAPYLSPAAC